MKILYITPNAADPLAFYRGSGPLSSMRKYHKIEYVQADGVNWATIKNCDVVFMQRPFMPEHEQVANLCKSWNVPLAIDFDDWLYALPPDNPAYHIYNNNRKSYHASAELADEVIVATQDMADMYMKEHGISATVVQNAYDTDVFTPRQLIDHSKIVLWRGSNSHMQDLFSVRLGFLELIRKHKDWQFVFMNCPPWFLGEDFENVKTLQPHNILEYMNVIQRIKPAIMTHPLQDCSFNRAKSMCSWIEASHAGAAFVGPSFREYQRDGLTQYEVGNSESFYKEINGLIMEPERIIDCAERGQRAITGELSLREVNKKRFEVFTRLQTK